MYRPNRDISILSAQVVSKRGVSCWKYRVKWLNLDEESWKPISHFFGSGTLLEVDAFWTRVGLVDWRSAETLKVGQEARPHTYTPSRSAATSQIPPLLPLELRALIAEQAPRATLMHFCATAREEYLYMMPILYRSIIQGVGTKDMRPLAKFLFTLGSTMDRRNLGPHPAILVRELRLHCVWKMPGELKGALQRALRCTADYAPDGKSQLRVFHLDTDRTTVPLMLNKRAAFENLTELSVVRSGSDTSQFEFLLIPGLKSLAYKDQTLFNRGEPTMSRFCRSLELLPTVSPDLTVLKVDISWAGPQIPLLEQTVNSLRFACLEVASIQVFLRDDFPGPTFNAFLEAHPTLYEVSVVLDSRPLRDNALPLLRAFTGRAGDFLKVCDGARPIRDLAVTLFRRNSNEGQASERGRAVVAALTETPNLHRLAIVNGYDAVYDDSSESEGNGIHMYGLDRSTICAIAKACSRITHLELHLKSTKRADVKALANLHELQWLRAHFWMTISNEGGPANDILSSK
ncbi:hypothetical protein B0H16DRAFT_125553 [Mycena metata]|uniref:Chromo domain-containing protein n=1 Tax=Mycena metata TaxID=1033252 RepID=A0AAD7MY62_9AGAR|nr:hypothetical protein B0H16DRAFT_125553 [Mycena metata]